MESKLEIPKKQRREKVLAAKLTLAEHLAINKFCKREKIKKSDLVRFLLAKNTDCFKL